MLLVNQREVNIISEMWEVRVIFPKSYKMYTLLLPCLPLFSKLVFTFFIIVVGNVKNELLVVDDFIHDKFEVSQVKPIMY